MQCNVKAFICDRKSKSWDSLPWHLLPSFKRLLNSATDWCPWRICNVSIYICFIVFVTFSFLWFFMFISRAATNDYFHDQLICRFFSRLVASVPRRLHSRRTVSRPCWGSPSRGRSEPAGLQVWRTGRWCLPRCPSWPPLSGPPSPSGMTPTTTHTKRDTETHDR